MAAHDDDDRAPPLSALRRRRPPEAPPILPPVAHEEHALAPIIPADPGWSRPACMDDACILQLASMLGDALAAELGVDPARPAHRQLLSRAVRAAVEAFVSEKQQGQDASETEDYGEEVVVPDAPQRTHINFFVNMLNSSETRTHAGRSLLRMGHLTLEVVAKDMDGVQWCFCIQGQHRRHLLRSGWSICLSAERLVSGDPLRFVRTTQSEFIVSFDRYCEYQIQKGMRIKMRFEGEEVEEKRFVDTLVVSPWQIELPVGPPPMMLQQVPHAPPEDVRIVSIPRELGGTERQQIPHAPPEDNLNAAIPSESVAEMQQAPQAPPEGNIIIDIPPEMGAERQEVRRAAIASELHRLDAEREFKKQWKFILKILIFLSVVFTLVGIFGAVGAFYLRIGNFLKWKLKTWELQFVQLAVSWTIIKPMSVFREHWLVKVLLSLFCFINDIGTSLVFCSALTDYLSIRCYLLMPMMIISLVPFTCWSIYMKKEVSVLPIWSWSATVLVTILKADMAGWIPLPGQIRISDYGGTLVAVSFLLFDLRRTDCNASAVMTAIDLYVEMCVESWRRILSTVTKALVFT